MAGAMMVMAAPVRRRGVRTLVAVVRLIVIAPVVMDDAARQNEGQRGENRNFFQRGQKVGHRRLHRGCKAVAFNG